MHMTGIGAGSTCTHMPMHVRVRVRARSGEAADAVGDKWTEGSVLQTYPEAVRAVLAEAPELAHLAGAWEDYVGEGGHSLSAMQALTLTPPLPL